MQLMVGSDGQVRCLYDEMIDLHALGIPFIVRASQVEPDEKGQWWANMDPLQGPQLGPFALRRQALAAERDWLEKHWLNSPTA